MAYIRLFSLSVNYLFNAPFYLHVNEDNLWSSWINITVYNSFNDNPHYKFEVVVATQHQFVNPKKKLELGLKIFNATIK